MSIPGVAPPPTPPQFIVGQGADQLRSSDLYQGFAGGPRVGLIRHDDSGYDPELSFFEIDGWSSAQSIAPGGGTPVFLAPGGFVQTTDNPMQNMAWSDATRLYNAELNLRWELGDRVTILAGFRWVNLWDQLQGTIVPSDRSAPFWNTVTTNNLYGFQLGQQWNMLKRGGFSVEGLVKAGYEALWLQGLALAPGQIPQTQSHGTPLPDVYVQATGVDASSAVFFHGANVGLEYAF